MRLYRTLCYFLAEGATAMWRNKALHGFALFVVILSLFILGFSRYLTGNVSRLLASWEQDLEVRVFLEDGVSRERVAELTGLLSGNPSVRSVAYVSKEDALEVLRSFAPSFAVLAEEFPENPLPASLSLRLRGGADLSAVGALIDGAGGQEGVSQVLFDWDWVDRLRTYTRFAGLLGWLLSSALGLAALFIVAAIMKILALSRREEIAILHFIGGTAATIRGPFVAGGAILGLLSGLGALGLLALAHELLRRWGGEEAPILAWVSESPLPPAEQLLLVLGGLLLGGIGGALSLGSVRRWGEFAG